MDHNSKNEVDYEGLQLQIILFKEIQKQSLLAERALKKQQDQEYLDAQNIDVMRLSSEEPEPEPESEPEPQSKELSLEEMRKIRLKRFGSTE